MSTVGELVDRSCAALDALAVLGEEIEDEWQYIADLRAVWTAELRRVAADQGSAAAALPQAAAIDRLIAETALIADPHRAIDWLSTFPQAALLALRPGG